MPDRPESADLLAHLERRAGFGRAAGERPRAEEYEAAVDRLLAELDSPAPEDPPGFDPYRPLAIQQAWLDRMVAGPHPLVERLAFFWHGHFATSDGKVQDPALLWAQYRRLRSRGGGRFRDLLDAVSRDPAMIRFLDGNSNRRGHPNENYAREVQELFTLGIGNYTEGDVREAARAFTGWGTRHHEFAYRDEFHDHGEKSLHGETGDLSGEDVVRILADHPATARFLATKWIRAFSSPEPAPADTQALARAFSEADGSVARTLRALFLSASFRAPAHRRSLVRGPVEFCVAALRAVGAPAFPRWLHASLERMGQIPFRPPSVKGWTSGSGWLGSGGLVERLRVARRVADESATDPDAVAEAAFPEGIPPPLATALAGAPPRDRVALLLASPDFQLA